MNRIPRAIYTKELRDEAVKLALTEGVGVSETSRRLSIPIKTLANWVRAAEAGKLKDAGRHLKPLTEIEGELAQVKRELAEVEMERDLLKKFAENSLTSWHCLLGAAQVAGRSLIGTVSQILPWSSVFIV